MASSSQRSVRPTPPQTQTAAELVLPSDPNVLQGTLDNGFKYYVRRGGLPSGGVYLGLVVKAGWANEGDEQQGFLHLLAHMGFSGTPRFEPEKLAKLWRVLGLQPTADQRVVSSVDFTAHGLAVAADARAAIPTLLDLLADWSSVTGFETGQLERQRRAVLDEIRQAGGSEQPLARRTLDILLQGDGAAARRSAFAEKAIEEVSPQRLLEFYQAWYRPERMAVVAVGDLEPREIEQAIRDRFAGIRPSASATPPTSPVVQVSRETSFSVLPAPEPDESEDEEDEPEDRAPSPSTVVSVAFRSPGSPMRTRADLRESVIENVYGSLMQARLDGLVRRAGSPLRAARWWTVPQIPMRLSVAQAIVKPWGLEAGLQALWTELREVGLRGFQPDEVAGAFRTIKASIGAGVALDGSGRVMTSPESIFAHFLRGDVLVSDDVKRGLQQEALSQLGPADINAFARAFSESAARIVLASGPKDQLRPGQALRAAVDRAETGQAGPAPSGVIAGSLVAALPVSGAVVHEEAISEIGATVWRLSNGATVIIKPTGFAHDEILFQARAPGGTSLASDRDYWSATLAPQVVSAAGLGLHSPEALRKLLAGRSVEAHPWVSETGQGIQAKATREDLEIMMQLVHLGFTAPRADPESFDEVRNRWREELRERDADPNQVFAELRRQQSFGNHPRRRPATLKTVGQVRWRTALTFYRQRFSQSSNFTFVFVGDIDRDRLKPLVERYLASLPNNSSRDQRSHWRDVGARLASGVKRIGIEGGSGDISTVVLTFHRQSPWSAEAETALEALRGYLEIRTRQSLAALSLAARSLSVTSQFERRPMAQSSLTMQFDCSRAEVDESKRIVLDVIRQVQASPAHPSEVGPVRDARRQYVEGAWGKNAFWLQRIAEQYELGSDPREILKLRTDVNRIDPAMIERAARDDLDLDNYVEAVRSSRRK